MGIKKRPAVERFWEQVEKRPDGCWIFGFERDKHRYGQLADDNGKNGTAHRFSYRLHHGEIPLGLYVCHTCDVRRCVNPDHLYAGTHEDNTRDLIERKRTARNTARKVGTAKRYRLNRALLPQQREELKAEYASGQYTQMELADRWRLSQGAVSAIIRGWPGRKPDGGKRRTGSFRRKLSSETYAEIRALYAAGGITQQQLAERFNCDQTHVSNIIRYVSSHERRNQSS